MTKIFRMNFLVLIFAIIIISYTIYVHPPYYHAVFRGFCLGMIVCSLVWLIAFRLFFPENYKT